MKHFDKGLAVIKEFEVKRQTKKTVEETALRVDKIVDYLRNNVTTKLNYNQLAALISFVYSVSLKSFAKSAMLKHLQSGDTKSASFEFENWVMRDGKVDNKLVDRRAAEFHLFNSPVE